MAERTRKKVHKLTYNDRLLIAGMLKNNKKVPEIAKTVGVINDTIYRELRRGGTPYSPEYAMGVRDLSK